jgi:hypothetical protein
MPDVFKQLLAGVGRPPSTEPHDVGVSTRTPPPPPPRSYSPPAHVAKSPLGPARPPRHGRRDSDAEIVEKVGKALERERKQKALLDGMMENIIGVPPMTTQQQAMYGGQAQQLPPPPPPPPAQRPPPHHQFVLPNGTLLATPPRHHMPINLQNQTMRQSQPPPPPPAPPTQPHIPMPPPTSFHAPAPTYPATNLPMLLAQQAQPAASPPIMHTVVPFPPPSAPYAQRPPHIASPMTGHRAELLNMLASAGSTTSFTQDRRNNDGGAGAGQYGVVNGHVDRSGTGMMVHSPRTNATTSAQPRPLFPQNNASPNANPEVWLSILKGT